MVNYSKLYWTLADDGDKAFFVIGIISAVLSGLGLPSFVFLFGDIADSFAKGNDTKDILERISSISKILTFIGLGVWFGSYLFFSFLTIASERIGLKTKTTYLKSILNQEIAWFD
jgi:predicted RND superfamily exporter protein